MCAKGSKLINNSPTSLVSTNVENANCGECYFHYRRFVGGLSAVQKHRPALQVDLYPRELCATVLVVGGSPSPTESSRPGRAYIALYLTAIPHQVALG